MDRNAPIQELNGVGPKTEKILQKLGVYTVGDILLAFQGIISGCRSQSISV